MAGNEVDPTVAELSTRQAVEDARIVERAFELWWHDNEYPGRPKGATAAAFRAGFDLARQLFLDTQRAGTRPDEPSAGFAESGGSDPLAATPARLNSDASGGPPPTVTRGDRYIVGGDGIPYGPFEEPSNGG